MGADLAVIKSEDEHQFVYDLLRNTKGTAMGGLDCIGKPITNFIRLMTTLRREIIRGGTTANQVETGRIVGIVEEATLRENGMTFLAQIPTPMLFASDQFRQRKLQTYINGTVLRGMDGG